jgi:hypothetical protein
VARHSPYKVGQKRARIILDSIYQACVPLSCSMDHTALLLLHLLLARQDGRGEDGYMLSLSTFTPLQPQPRWSLEPSPPPASQACEQEFICCCNHRTDPSISRSHYTSRSFAYARYSLTSSRCSSTIRRVRGLSSRSHSPCEWSRGAVRGYVPWLYPHGPRPCRTGLAFYDPSHRLKSPAIRIRNEVTRRWEGKSMLAQLAMCVFHVRNRRSSNSWSSWSSGWLVHRG